MTVLDFCGVIVIILIAGVILIMLAITLWWTVTTPYFNYKIKKKENKLQWRCREYYKSKTTRMSDPEKPYECYIEYRVLPSELNTLTRIFSNEWKDFSDGRFIFKDKNDFINFVHNFKTYGDVKKFYDEKNDIIWYEPED